MNITISGERFDLPQAPIVCGPWAISLWRDGERCQTKVARMSRDQIRVNRVRGMDWDWDTGEYSALLSLARAELLCGEM